MRFRGVVLVFAILLGGIGCEDLLEVVDISNSNVTVFAPLDGATINSNSVQFNWDTVTEATSYRMQLAEPDFENTVQVLLDTIFVEDSIGNVPSQIQQDLLNGNYTWRIKASNSGFETPYTENAFVVDGDENADIVPPNTPALVTPSDGTSQDETTVAFSWTRTDVPGTAERDSICLLYTSDAADD